MRRKRYQRGSLKSRKRNGREYWYAQWREAGRPKSKEFGLCSRVAKSEALAKLDVILRPINGGAGRPPDTAQTFQQFVENVYLPTKKDGCWKGSTTMTTEGLVKTHLITALRTRAMPEISRSELQKLLKSKAASGLSRSVVDHVHWQLSAIFKMAAGDGVVSVDPTSGLHTPRCAEPKVKLIMAIWQIKQGLTVLSVRERLIVRLAIHEGMRPGEVLGLQVGDVRDEVLWVRRRVYRGEIDSPKVRRSHREVALTMGTASLLTEWVDSLSNRRPEAWLFPSETGSTPISRDNIWRRYILPVFEKAGLAWATFQVMRRTFATLSKEAGVDAKIRADHMGNSVDVNENEYTLTSFDQRREAVRMLELLIDRKEEDQLVSSS
jgi:integrase